MHTIIAIGQVLAVDGFDAGALIDAGILHPPPPTHTPSLFSLTSKRVPALDDQIHSMNMYAILSSPYGYTATTYLSIQVPQSIW